MTIEELLFETGRQHQLEVPEADALREDAALVDAGLVSVRIEPVLGLAALLFDCRAALAAREGDTSILLVDGLSRFELTALPAQRNWPRVETWSPSRCEVGFHLDAFFGREGNLMLEGGAAHYFIGNTRGIPAVAPDLTSASPGQIQTGFAGWSSEFRPAASTRLGGDQ